MRRYPTGAQLLVREMNISSVLHYIHSDAPLSRAQLASLTGLNKTTVSSLVEELLDRELIYEVGIDSSGTGRPATLLDLNPHAGYIIGVELGVGFILVVLANFIGELIWQRRLETDATEPRAAIIAQALQSVDEAIEISTARKARLLGLGLTLPGIVDVESGRLVFSPNLGWRDVPLRQIFHEHSGLAVFVDNDANAAAIGEHLFGAARQIHDFICLIASVGIGSGLFLNGELYRGACGFAGEIGHTSIIGEQTRPCRCGNRGCWETTSNQYSVVERIRARLEVGRDSIISTLLAEPNYPLTLSIIAQAAAAQDVETLEALTETGKAIGVGIANLVNIFNPAMIVIGGAMADLGAYLLPSIKTVVAERAFAEMQDQVQIVLSAFGSNASVIGAVAMVTETILTKPTDVERSSARANF